MTTNWYYNDDGDNLGETTWDYYNPDILEDIGFTYDTYDGWQEENDE